LSWPVQLSVERQVIGIPIFNGSKSHNCGIRFYFESANLSIYLQAVLTVYSFLLFSSQSTIASILYTNLKLSLSVKSIIYEVFSGVFLSQQISKQYFQLWLTSQTSRMLNYSSKRLYEITLLP
jgi:hypothetical protein